MRRISKFFVLVGRAVALLQRNNPLLISGATAFFTVFSLPPIIILLGNILSKIVFRTEVITDRIYDQLDSIFGEATTNTVTQIVENFQSMASNRWITVGGVIFLIFVSTTLFNVIQQSIHRMWRIRTSATSNIMYRLRHRGIALLIIILAGILVLITAIAETILAVMKDYLADFLPDTVEFFSKPAGLIIALVVYALWFAGLFRYLPGARMPFRFALQGGLFTAVLFSLGKFILSKVLITERFGAIFGASASILLLMLFIFYSSLLVYLGAAFTIVLLKDSGKELRVRKHSERYKITSG